jgi:hypothetical protein
VTNGWEVVQGSMWRFNAKLETLGLCSSSCSFLLFSPCFLLVLSPCWPNNVEHRYHLHPVALYTSPVRETLLFLLSLSAALLFRPFSRAGLPFLLFFLGTTPRAGPLRALPFTRKKKASLIEARKITLAIGSSPSPQEIPRHAHHTSLVAASPVGGSSGERAEIWAMRRPCRWCVATSLLPLSELTRTGTFAVRDSVGSRLRHRGCSCCACE